MKKVREFEKKTGRHESSHARNGVLHFQNVIP